MATGSTGPTGTTGPRLCPTPSWKEEELSGLGEGTRKKNTNTIWYFFPPLYVMHSFGHDNCGVKIPIV